MKLPKGLVQQFYFSGLTRLVWFSIFCVTLGCGKIDGSVNTIVLQCADNAFNSNNCDTVGSRFIASATGSSIVAPDGTISIGVPLGYYDGTKTATFTDSDLLAANIENGVSLFGVTGTYISTYGACTDNSLNAGQCSTAVSRYVTATAGSNISGSNGNITETIPLGFHDGTKVISMGDTDLVAANIRSGTSLFGVTGSMIPRHGNCTDNSLNASQCSTAAGRYVTATAGANVSGSDGSLSATIPLGYQDGAKTFTASDSDLVAANIKTGITVFGVAGSMIPRYSACSDDTNNVSQCSTAAGRYVTGTAGANITGSNGSLSATISTGFHDGTKTFTATDTDLVAGNIKNGIDIFGVTGNMIPRLSACTDDALNAGQCSTASGRYVTATAGANISGIAGNPSKTIPLAFYAGTETFTASDADLTAGNIKTGVTIFGVTGTFIPIYSACSDDALNASQCSTAAGRYVTATAGANISGADGSLSATIPLGFHDGTKTFTASDSDLIASNVLNGVNLFGVNGSMIARYSACSDDALNASQCSTAAGRYVTATAGANISGADGSLSATIPLGFHDGTKTFTASDSDLIASNVLNGVNLFGVNGSMIARYSACSDDTLNASQCSTAAGRYVTATAGANISGADGSLSATIPLGFYSGKTFTASDTDLVAGNIKTGIVIFGVTGTVIPAYSDCTDDASNAGKCTSTNRYVSGTLGNNVTLTTSTSASIPTAFQNGTKSCSISDTDLAAGNIKSGIQILGVTGTATGEVPEASHMNRVKSASQISVFTEAVTNGTTNYTNSSTGYRAVPNLATDQMDWTTTPNVTFVDRSTWGATTCGTTQATVALRIANCATVFGAEATWDGTVKGFGGHGVWKLVTRTAAPIGAGNSTLGREVWQDQKTKLLWSSKVAYTGLSWCKASGSNNIVNNPTAENDPSGICTNATYQATGTGPGVQAVSACFEDGNNYFTNTDAAIDNSGKAGLGYSSTPAVYWRLPNLYDMQEAHANGIANVLPDMISSGAASVWEWLATISSPDGTPDEAYQFNSSKTTSQPSARTSTASFGARCVGRGL